jgi:hypothetical protein
MNEKDLEMNDLQESSETENKQIEKDTDAVEFTIDDFELYPISSSEMLEQKDFLLKTSEVIEVNESDVHLKVSLAQPLVGAGSSVDEGESVVEDPIFKELSTPKLPKLASENRARLQMQSPTRLHFYWSFKNNPFQALNRAFSARANNFKLVVKLVNQTQGEEEIMPIETEGSAWFDVDANSTYRAEVGFYAPNNIFTRVMFSNTVETPRKNPSLRRDFSTDWSVSAQNFAEVLNGSGFSQDAFEVALAGDDAAFSDNATQNAFSQILENQKTDFVSNDSSEIRFTLLALASGISLGNLRGQISKKLFAALSENAENISAAKALAALQENFGEFEDEFLENEEFGNTVFGSSLLNFPKISKRRFLPKFSPISSF